MSDLSLDIIRPINLNALKILLQGYLIANGKLKMPKRQGVSFMQRRQVNTVLWWQVLDHDDLITEIESLVDDAAKDNIHDQVNKLLDGKMVDIIEIERLLKEINEVV